MDRKKGRPSADRIEREKEAGAASGPHELKCPHPECKRIFISKKSLKKHFTIHTGVKPYSCTYPECDKAFRQRGHLETHIARHTKAFPYNCPKPDCTQHFRHSNRPCPTHKLKMKKLEVPKFGRLKNLTPEEVEWIKKEERRRKMQSASCRKANTNSASISIVEPTPASTYKTRLSHVHTAGPLSARTNSGSNKNASIRRSAPCSTRTRRLSPCSESTSRPRPLSNLELMNGLGDNKENHYSNSTSQHLSYMTLSDALHSDEPKSNSQLLQGSDNESEMLVEDVHSSRSGKVTMTNDREYQVDETSIAAGILVYMRRKREPI